jgi:hypothetical protein
MRERVQRLRDILKTATDFREPWDYFHDQLVLDPAFMRLGKVSESMKLSTTLTAIGTRLLGKNAGLSRCTTVNIKDLSFWHGSCFLGGYTGICFYFEDSDQGLLGLVKDLQSTQILLARISLVAIPEGVSTVVRGGSA